MALLVEGDQAREIDGLRRALGDPALGRIEPHVTLVPPLNVAESALERVDQVLAEAATSTRPFSVRLGPPTTFLPDSPVAYLACGAGSEDVVAVMERAFRPPLWKTRAWPYVPHVTLAEITDPGRLLAAVAALADFEVQVTFDRLYLLRQVVHGGEWQREAEFRFTGRPHVVGRGGLETAITLSDMPPPYVRDWITGLGRGGAWPGVGRTVWFVARSEGHLAAAAEIEIGERSSVVLGLVVAEQYRRQGIGSQLLAAVVSHAAQIGHRWIESMVAVNSPFLGFASASGWRPADAGSVAAGSVDTGATYVLYRRYLAEAAG